MKLAAIVEIRLSVANYFIVAIFYQDFQAKNKLNAKNQNRFKGAMRIVLTEALFLHQDSNLDHQHGPYLIGNDAPR